MKKIVLFSFLSFILTSCATIYQAPSNKPTATIAVRNQSFNVFGGNTWLGFFKDPITCHELESAPRSSVFSGAPVVIEANTLSTIYVVKDFVANSIGNMDVPMFAISFYPKQNKHYLVDTEYTKNEKSGFVIRVSVLDAATHSPVAIKARNFKFTRGFFTNSTACLDTNLAATPSKLSDVKTYMPEKILPAMLN